MFTTTRQCAARRVFKPRAYRRRRPRYFGQGQSDMSQGALLLAFAILFEVIGTTCMKLSEGFTRLWPSLGIVVFYVASFTCLTLALRHLQVSVAYAIWAGLGTVLITLIGVMLFHEPMSAWRAGCIALVLVGVIGLNLSHG
ncbi:multidrug efflux SMR transporter [Salinisphaera sp. C84B14]|uniref:DMT family transporter n=1 Tax=Salinisphaera sp. C84B14 TaxID=1304155 RepID=UPI00333ED6CF